MQDHPRSRGVYRHSLIAFAISTGSSPLARGLHGVAVGDAPESGIIPARAGFTNLVWRTRFPNADHPRSRGVYTLPDATIMMADRIIPARAGFTRWERST